MLILTPMQHGSGGLEKVLESHFAETGDFSGSKWDNEHKNQRCEERVVPGHTSKSMIRASKARLAINRQAGLDLPSCQL